MTGVSATTFGEMYTGLVPGPVLVMLSFGLWFVGCSFVQLDEALWPGPPAIL